MTIESRGTGSWNTNSSRAFFLGPLQYVNIPNGSTGPLWSKHNHDPALAVVPGSSGDIVAVWFTTYVEPGREAALAVATLKAGEETPILCLEEFRFVWK